MFVGDPIQKVVRVREVRSSNLRAPTFSGVKNLNLLPCKTAYKVGRFAFLQILDVHTLLISKLSMLNITDRDVPVIRPLCCF